MATRLFSVFIILIVSGCVTRPVGDSAKPKDSAPLVSATDILNQATAKAEADKDAVIKKQDDRDSSTLADINQAKTANADNPPGTPKIVVDSSLEVAKIRLSGVTPDPQEVARMAQDAALVAQGKAAQAQSDYALAQTQAQALAGQLVTAKTDVGVSTAALQKAQVDQKTAQQTYITTAEANAKKAADEIAAEKAKALKAQQDKQAQMLDTVGWISLGIFVVGTALGVSLGALAGLRIGLKIVWIFLPIGLFALGLAQLITQWWFMYACGAAGLICVGCLGIWLYSHYKTHSTVSAVTDKLAQANGALQAIVPTLDKVYEDGAPEVKTTLDNLVFDPLSKTMSTVSKKVIHLVRADLSLSQKPTPVSGPVTPVN